MSIWLFVAVFAGVMISAIACVGLERAFVTIARSIGTRRQLSHDDDWNDQSPPKSLNYNYIDWLERDLEVGKYDPDRIALGFDDTEQKPEPDAVEVNERCPCVACRSRRRDAVAFDREYLGRVAKAKPVDDSWADADVRDGVYGPKTGGLLRRIVDNHGNWTEIRSFGG